MNIANNINPLNKKHTSILSKLMYFLITIVLICTICFITKQIEGQAPNIIITTTPSIGKSHVFPIHVEDFGCGIRKINVVFIKNGFKFKLAEKQIISSKFWNHSRQRKIKFQIPFSVIDLNLTDGAGLLQVIAWDSSFRNFGRGNKSSMEIELKIDTHAPTIKVLNSTKKINQSGSGVVLYQVSEPCLKSGIMVGNNFFPWISC